MPALPSSRRAWVFVLLLGALGVALGIVAALASDEKWLVSAKVLLQIGPETAGTRPSMVGSPAPFLAGNPRREDVQTEVELLNNPELLRRAFGRLLERDEAAALGPDSGAVSTTLRRLTEGLGLLPARSRAERALDHWASSLRIVAVPSSTVLVVECRATHPDAAVQLLEIMLAMYLEDHRAAFGGRGMPTVLAGLVSTCEHTLADNEARLTNLRSEQGVVDTVQETSQTILSRMAGDTRVREARAKLAGSKARLSSLTAVLGVTPEQLKAQQEEAPNPLRDDLELRLTTARQALITAEQEFTEDAPEVRRAKQMVTLLDEMVGHVTPTREAIVTLGRNPLHDSLLDLLAKATAEVAATDAELATALASLAELDKRLLQLESSRAALQKAEQDVLETKKDLTQAHDGLRLARIESLLDENQVANVTIVAKPGFLPTPMRSFGLPARLALAVGGLLGGLGAGITWVLWRASRRSEARREA